jgi:hypothetical protein
VIDELTWPNRTPMPATFIEAGGVRYGLTDTLISIGFSNRGKPTPDPSQAVGRYRSHPIVPTVHLRSADPLKIRPTAITGSRSRLEGLHSYPHICEVEHPAPEDTLATVLHAPLLCCRWELERRHMTPPSNIALRIIVEEDPTLVRALNTHYVDAAPDGGLDTVERDALFDALGRHFTGQPWPRSGGMDATRRFMADLQRAMTRAGWSVDLFAVA